MQDDIFLQNRLLLKSVRMYQKNISINPIISVNICNKKAIFVMNVSVRFIKRCVKFSVPSYIEILFSCFGKKNKESLSMQN